MFLAKTPQEVSENLIATFGNRLRVRICGFLIEDENGQLVTAPSISPENAFIHPTNREKTWLSYAVTIDIQIINELFNACITAANIVGDDPEFKFELKESLSKRLFPTK